MLSDSDDSPSCRISTHGLFCPKGIYTQVCDQREKERCHCIQRIEKKQNRRDTIEHKKRKRERNKNTKMIILSRGVDGSFWVFSLEEDEREIVAFVPKKEKIQSKTEQAQRRMNERRRKTFFLTQREGRRFCFLVKIISHFSKKTTTPFNQSRICRTAAADYFSFHPHLS